MRSVTRRVLTAVTCAAMLTVGGVVANPVGAAAGNTKISPERRHGGHEGHTDEDDDSGRKVPSPPRPDRAKPLQRLLTTDPGQPAGGRGRGRGSASTATATGASAATDGTATASTVRAAAGGRTGAAAPGGGRARTLVLYDATGPYAFLGELYGMLAANLVSHFGSWSAHPVGSYAAGELSGYTAVVYLGSTYDEPVPVAFLDDVLATKVPVVWAYDNIWQLTARQADFATARGFTWKQFDFASVGKVNYRGTNLTRDAANAAGIMDQVVTDPAKAKVLATAVRADGSTMPWAVRSANLTYIGEIPFAYMTHDDRYLAFADLLFDVLAPTTATRHRAMVRIEDVGPDADPAELRAVADYLSSKRVPFTVAVYPRYRDPLGVNNNGRAEDYTLRHRPQVVSALKYMQAKGGTLLMHGYTHQYESRINPYDAVSANDFEFYAAHVDDNDSVIYDGPVARDSALWAGSRIMSAATEFQRAGLAVPKIFEFPHYAGSVTDYQVVQAAFGTRYDRGLYFTGYLSGTALDYSKLVGQFFPYTVRDVYGSAIVPENIGNVEPDAQNNHPARLPADLIASAKSNLVVRDGYASFFYHPYHGTAYLKQVVEGVQGLGYTFVPASAALS